jgi:hypothetical protein
VFGTSSIANTWVVDGEKAFIRRTKLKVNLDFVVLKGNQWKCKSRVAAEPELKWHVKCRFRKGLARGTDSGGDIIARASGVNCCERRIAEVGQLSGLSNHFVVSTFLFGSKRELVPDVHPITILAVDALSSNLNFNHGDKLLTGEV